MVIVCGHVALLASYPVFTDGRKECLAGFTRLHMREVNYFHCSISLHSDVTILIVSN